MKAKVVYTDGSRYEGEMRDEAYEGAGRFTSADGVEFAGFFVANRLQGVAEVKISGDRVIAHFEDGKMDCAACKVHYSNGDFYEGALSRAMQRDGAGKMLFKSGPFKEYDGLWKADQFDGEGTLLLADGSQYSGGFEAGRFEGRGLLATQTYTLSGEWRDGKLQKITSSQTRQGDRFEGRVRDGLPAGQGKAADKNGVEYEGGFKDGMKEGPGVLRWGASVLEGEFRRDLLEGPGVLQGEQFRAAGSFEENCLQGKATVTLANNDVLKGTFYQNYKHGPFSFTRADSGRSCSTHFQYDVEDKSQFDAGKRF